VNDDDIVVDDIEEGVPELGPEHQNHLPNPKKVTKEMVTYHLLINGMLPHL